MNASLYTHPPYIVTTLRICTYVNIDTGYTLIRNPYAVFLSEYLVRQGGGGKHI